MPHPTTGNARTAIRRRGRPHGSVFVWSLSFSLLMLLAVVGHYPFTLGPMRAMEFTNEQSQALALAEAGVDEGLWYLNRRLTSLVQMYYFDNSPGNDVDNVPVDRADLNNDGAVNVFGDLIPAIVNPWTGWSDTTPGNGSCTPPDKTASNCKRTFSLRASDGASLGNATVQVDGISFPQPTITTTGRFPTSQNPRATRTIQVLLEAAVPSFQYAAFGGERLTFGTPPNTGPVRVDSYDSGLGAYGADLSASPDAAYGNLNKSGSGAGTGASQHGDIGTNAAASFNPDVSIVNPNVLVNGKLFVVPGTQVTTYNNNPLNTYVTKSSDAQRPQKLPPVQIPSSLTGISGWTAAPPGVSGTNGNYTVGSGDTWNCTGPTRVQSLNIIDGGVFRMTGDCQLLVDNGYTSTWALDTTNGGKIVKADITKPAKIFIRDGDFNLDGAGAGFDTVAVPNEADRKPSLFRLYQTCTTPPCTYPQTSVFAQYEKFYGVVYVQDGSLDMRRSSSGSGYDGKYYGAFVVGKTITLGGMPTSYTVYVHYDEAAGEIPLDGTDPPPFGRRFKIISWQIDTPLQPISP